MSLEVVESENLLVVIVSVVFGIKACRLLVPAIVQLFWKRSSKNDFSLSYSVVQYTNVTEGIKVQKLVYTKLKLTHTHPDYMHHCLGLFFWLRIPQNVSKAASAILQDTTSTWSEFLYNIFHYFAYVSGIKCLIYPEPILIPKPNLRGRIMFWQVWKNLKYPEPVKNEF